MFLQVISVDCVTVVCAWRCCGVPVWKCCVCACVRSVPCGVFYVACAGPCTNFLPPEPILQNSLTTSSSSNPSDPSKPSHSSPPPEARNENFKNPRVATPSKWNVRICWTPHARRRRDHRIPRKDLHDFPSIPLVHNCTFSSTSNRSCVPCGQRVILKCPQT